MLQIYIPNLHANSGDHHLADFGLEHLTHNAPYRTFRGVLQNGPDGGHGTLIGFGCQPAVDLEKQTWVAAVPAGDLPAGRYWVGWPKVGVLPQDLERPHVSESKAVELDDGQTWQIPIARELPHSTRLNRATGQVVRSVSERYRDFYEQAEKFFNATVAQESHGLTMVDAWHFICRALAINYLITPEVIDELGLLREDATALEASGATFELQEFLEIGRQKKTAELTSAI